MPVRGFGEIGLICSISPACMPSIGMAMLLGEVCLAMTIITSPTMQTKKSFRLLGLGIISKLDHWVRSIQIVNLLWKVHIYIFSAGVEFDLGPMLTSNYRGQPFSVISYPQRAIRSRTPRMGLMGRPVRPRCMGRRSLC